MHKGCLCVEEEHISTYKLAEFLNVASLPEFQETYFNGGDTTSDLQITE